MKEARVAQDIKEYVSLRRAEAVIGSGKVLSPDDLQRLPTSVSRVVQEQSEVVAIRRVVEELVRAPSARSTELLLERILVLLRMVSKKLNP